MTQKIKISDLPEFDVTEYLDNEQAIAEYLTVVMEENDPAALAEALRTVARARHDRGCQGVQPDKRSAIQGAAP